MEDSFLRPIVGRCLGGVCFVMNCVELHFNDAVLTALNPLTVSAGGKFWARDEAGWRDALCARIGRTVKSASNSESGLIINLDDAATLTLSLRSEDFAGPQAFNFTSPGDPTIVG